MMISFKLRSRISYKGHDNRYESRVGKLMGAKSEAGEYELNRKLCLPKIESNRWKSSSTHTKTMSRGKKPNNNANKLLLPPIK